MTLPGIEAAYLKLQAFLVAASAANALAPIAEEARSSNRVQLDLVREYLARLGPTGDLGVGLVDGSVAPERWAAIADAQASALTTVMQTIGEENVFERFWGEIVLPTAKDVGDTAKAAVIGGGISFGVILALFLLAKLAGGLR